MGFDLFTKIAIVTVTAALLVWVMQKIRQSAVVAYLALGVVLGPSVFGLLPTGAEAQGFAEIGVVLLLFFIGLEFHVGSFRKMLKFAAFATLLQIGFCAGGIAALGMMLGFSVIQSVIIGLATALSSTAIVMKSFEERRESDSASAQTALAVLLGQDIVALLIVATLPLFGARDSSPLVEHTGLGLSPAWTLAVLVVALPTLFFVARIVLPVVFKRAAVARNPEGFALCSLAACLLVAVLAQRVGASPALGAFLGGLVFAGTPYQHQIRADLSVLKNLALGFFFVTVGMLMDLDYVGHHIPLMLGGVVVIVGVKTLFTTLSLKLLKQPWSVAAGAGLALAQVGEFAFLLAAGARARGILEADQYQLLIALSVFTMLVAPALVTRSRAFGGVVARHAGHAEVEPARKPTTEISDDLEVAHPRPRAVVVGYGPVGMTLCKILIRFGVAPCVIDLKLDTVEKLRKMGREAVYGDAGQRDILTAAGITEARYLLISLPDLASRGPVITSARAINPLITIISRARYLDERKLLEEAGVNYVSYEECEVAVELARLMLQELNVSRELLEHEVLKVRREIAVRTGFTEVVQRPTNAPPGGTEMFRLGGEQQPPGGTPSR